MIYMEHYYGSLYSSALMIHPPCFVWWHKHSMCQKILIYISVIVKESKKKKELKEVMSMSIANPLETL